MYFTVYMVESLLMSYTIWAMQFGLACRIEYRQKNLCDALRNPDIVRQLYEITVETEKQRRSSWHWLSSVYLSSTFSSAVELLKIYTEMLMELRLVADSKLSGFQSEGFRNLLTMLQRELDDNYFAGGNHLVGCTRMGQERART